MLTLVSKGSTQTVSWKQGSVLGFGGDHSQQYVLCTYKLSGGDTVPVYVQASYDIKESMTINSSLQYGMQEGVLFFVYHDKSQTPYQYRFRSTNLEKFALAANEVLKMARGVDLSWIAGEYLHNI
jgi:hypothetical protein